MNSKGSPSSSITGGTAEHATTQNIKQIDNVEMLGIMRMLFGEDGCKEFAAMRSIHRPSKRVHRVIGGYLKERWISFDERNMVIMLERCNLPQFSCAVSIAKWVTAVYEFWLTVPGCIVEILNLERSTLALHKMQLEVMGNFVDFSSCDLEGRMIKSEDLSTYKTMQDVVLAHTKEIAVLQTELHHNDCQHSMEHKIHKDNNPVVKSDGEEAKGIS